MTISGRKYVTVAIITTYLNKNWAKNVRAALKKKLGAKEFERWEQMRLAMLDDQTRGMA